MFSFTSGLSGGKVTACWQCTPEMGVELRSTVGNSRVCKTKKDRKRKEKQKESTETQRGANMRESGRSRCAKVSSFPPLCKAEWLVYSVVFTVRKKKRKTQKRGNRTENKQINKQSPF